MIITNINTLFLISEEKVFKINTDFFETNILNLSIVIGILIFYGRTAFSKYKLNKKKFLNNKKA